MPSPLYKLSAKFLILSATILAFLGTNAKAAPEPRPVFDRDGSFSFCIADETYQDGRKLTLAQSPKGEINIGLSIPNGGFDIGGKYDLDATLSAEKTARPVRATGMDETTILLQMGGSPAFLKALRQSESLTLEGGGTKLDFTLPAMKTLLPSLTACLKKYKGVTDEVVKATEEAMPEPLKALLITAGFTDMVPVPLTGIPQDKRPADYVWSMEKGAIMAGVRERDIPEGKTLMDMVTMHVKGLKNKCDGSFKAEINKEQEEEGYKSRKVQVTCAPKIFVGLFFYITAAEKVTSFTFEGAPDLKEKILTHRNTLESTLKNLSATTK